MRLYKLGCLLVLAAASAMLLMSGGSSAQNEPGAPEEMSCPGECSEARKNCELSCSQIVGGGVDSNKRQRCIAKCGDEEGACNVRCANPTPKPTPKPKAYHDKTCADACEYKNRDCQESCSQFIGGGAQSAKRNVCIKDCGTVLTQCKDWCVNPTPPPTRAPQVRKDSPCAPECGTGRAQCEETCGMYQDTGKREACASGCQEAEYDCLDACTPGGD